MGADEGRVLPLMGGGGGGEATPSWGGDASAVGGVESRRSAAGERVAMVGVEVIKSITCVYICLQESSCTSTAALLV